MIVVSVAFKTRGHLKNKDGLSLRKDWQSAIITNLSQRFPQYTYKKTGEPESASAVSTEERLLLILSVQSCCEGATDLIVSAGVSAARSFPFNERDRLKYRFERRGSHTFPKIYRISKDKSVSISQLEKKVLKSATDEMIGILTAIDYWKQVTDN